MPPSLRKGILILLLIAILTIALAFIPNMLSDDLSAWCKERWGENYKYFLVAILPFCAVVLVLLTTDLGKYFLPGAGKKSTDRFNIPPGPKSRQTLNQAKHEISQGEPGEALHHLSSLHLALLDKEIDLLNSRFIDYQRTRRYATEAPDVENRTLNRITRDTRDLISDLEKELSSSTDNYDTIRAYLKKRYNNRVSQKLASRQPVNLRRLVNTDVVHEDFHAALTPYNSDDSSGAMLQTFQDAEGRLLLVGAPGAGKTTLLLQLVIELLEREPDALSVILNFASWSKEYITLDAWLEKILPAEMGISDRFAAEILQQNNLIPLFDGFDEIREEDRLSCLEALNRYAEDSHRQYVITSRKKEFQDINKGILIHLSIEVCPLSFDQLKAELQRLRKDAAQPERGALLLLDAIEKDSLLRKVVETPFYFNTLQILFNAGMGLTDLQFKSDTVEGRQTEIQERFVEYEMKAHTQRQYPAEKAKHWLAFLASRMTERNMVVFELRDLQYDWWKEWSRRELRKANQVSGLVSGILIWLVLGLILGLVYALISRLISGPMYGLVIGLIFGLAGCVHLGIAAGLAGGLFVGLFAGLIGGLGGGLMGGLGGGIAGWLVGGLATGLVSELPLIKTKDSINWTWKTYTKGLISLLVSWLVIGLIFGLIFGLGVGLVIGLIFGLGVVLGSRLLDLIDKSTDILQITTPYQRFNASKKVLHFSIFQHRLLCSQLRKHNLIPSDLVPFLNEMSLRHILEFDGDPVTGKGGGSWRFRHRILQEYFAEKWVEEQHGKKK